MKNIILLYLQNLNPVLYRILLKRKLLDKYLEYIIKSQSIDCEKNLSANVSFLCCAFIFGETKEGNDFWWNIFEKEIKVKGISY